MKHPKGLFSFLFLALFVTGLPTNAMAHTGVGGPGDFLAGIIHPLTGLDHMLAMLAIGFWAALQGRKTGRLIPAAFLTMLLLGVVWGANGSVLVMVNPAITLSLLLLGLLLVLMLRVSAVIGVAIAGAFALFHGHAHGVEISAAVALLPFVLGLIGTSLFLHSTGYAMGALAKRRDWPVRLAGIGVAGMGAWMAWGV